MESNKRISVLSKQVKTLADLKEVADAADKTVLNAKQYVEGNEDEHTSVFLELYECIRLWKMLRERLEPLMLEAIRQSQFTNNDATRLLVRSRETPDAPQKYTIEYVLAVLSLEKKLCVMLYDEGTRDHMLQEEKIFKDSSIVGFVADRAPQYPAIVKDLEGQELLRQACWFHARHYLVDAYWVDSRMEMH